MKITIVQPDIIWENRSANLKKIESLLHPVSGKTDLVILPEMFTTGFSMNTGNLAEEINAGTLAWMRSMSLERQFAICGSYIVDENHSFFNRFVFVTPDQKTYSYDKRHLFSIGGENDSYKPGKKRLVFTYNDVRISAIICYDLRFPVWIRNRNDYDLLICVSNWPDSRREVWNTLLKARAVENQCYVAGVNRVGSDNEENNYAGESVILDPRGRKIAEIKEYEEGIATGEISIPELISFRKNFPVWKDADDFGINV
jgi:omega-amidase